jgi:hypothetical protein
MISFSDVVQKNTLKKKKNDIEEPFSDFSILTSTPIASVNNNGGKQTLLVFSLLHAFLTVQRGPV